MSIVEQEKAISPHLQDLIDAANTSIVTLKEQVLEIYHTARNENFTPQESRLLIQVKVVAVSDRYLRQILPAEAKNQKMVRKLSKNIDTEDFEDDENEEEESENITTEDKKIAERVPQIPPMKHEIKKAELIEQDKEKEDIIATEQQTATTTPTSSLTTNNDEEILRLRNQITQLNEENAKLRIEKIGTRGNKFDFAFDLEVKDQILPLIVTAFPERKDGYVRLDKSKLKAN